MKKLHYLMQLACLIVALQVINGYSFPLNSVVLTQNEKLGFSTFSIQNEINTALFLDISQEELYAYLNRVIVLKDNKISYQRSKRTMVDDLSNIVNYHLSKHCAGLNAVFGGFSNELTEEIFSLDSKSLSSSYDEAQLKLQLFEFSSDLDEELYVFINALIEPEYTDDNPKTYPRIPLKLDPIEPPGLHFLTENSPPLLDPSGNPVLSIEKGELGDRITTLMESNNQLILVLSEQILAFQTELIQIKKDGLAYQQEFSDIHQRIDGLEEAINAIRMSNENSYGYDHYTATPNTEIIQVFFDKNSTAIESQYRIELQKVIYKLNNNRHFRIIITGYADKSGNKQLNDRISRLRALTVSNYLQNKGVKKSQLLINFVGDTQSSKETRSDRRVEIEWLAE